MVILICPDYAGSAFLDVDENTAYADAVVFLNEIGIMVGGKKVILILTNLLPGQRYRPPMVWTVSVDFYYIVRNVANHYVPIHVPH